MALTQKQKAAIARAPAAQKAAVKAGFEGQNANNRQQQPRVVATQRRARAAPKQKPKKTACKMRNFLDPLCPVPVPSVVSDGKALPHTSLVSTDFTVNGSQTTVLVATNTGDSGTVGYLFDIDENGKLKDSGAQVLTIPTLASSDTEGGPSASRAMKLSVTCINCSNALKRGGRVTYLNSSQRLPAKGTQADTQFADIVNSIKSSPYRKRITGDLLAHPLQLISYPVDSTEYSRFKPHHGTLNAYDFGRYVFGASAASEPLPRPMSIIVYVFEPVSQAQEYSVTIRASYYTRWPLTSVPGQSMKQIPTAPADHINTVRDHTEETANDLVHVAEGGALATIGPKIMSTVGNAVSRGLGNLASAAEAQAVGAIERGVETTLLEEAPLLLL